MPSLPGACAPEFARYRPRNARSTSLYRLFQDHFEDYLARRAASSASG